MAAFIKRAKRKPNPGGASSAGTAAGSADPSRTKTEIGFLKPDGTAGGCS